MNKTLIKKTSRWSQQEICCLKQLKQAQILKNYVNWTQIASKLNQKFQSFKKNSKNCRDKYINFIKYDKGQTSNFQWTRQEQVLLYDLYMQYGPSWNFYSNNHFQRSENSIKNKFHVNLRRFFKNLNEICQPILKKQKKAVSVSYNMLQCVIDFANMVQQAIKKYKLTLNTDSEIFRIKQKIIRYCFKQVQYTHLQLLQFLNQIKIINTHLRSFGIYKNKKIGQRDKNQFPGQNRNRRAYKLCEKSFESILKFDNIILQEIIKKQANTIFPVGPQNRQPAPMAFQDQISDLLNHYNYDYNQPLNQIPKQLGQIEAFDGLKCYQQGEGLIVGYNSFQYLQANSKQDGLCKLQAGHEVMDDRKNTNLSIYSNDMIDFNVNAEEQQRLMNMQFRDREINDNNLFG